MPKLNPDNAWKSALANMAWEKGTSKEDMLVEFTEYHGLKIVYTVQEVT